MVLFSPFIHTLTNPPYQAQRANAHSNASKCVDAAIQAVRIAQVLDAQGMLSEGHALSVDPLAIAATTLLAVELRAPEAIAVTAAKKASRGAKTLLEGLARYNNAAAGCLESLLVRATFYVPIEHEQR